MSRRVTKLPNSFQTPEAKQMADPDYRAQLQKAGVVFIRRKGLSPRHTKRGTKLWHEGKPYKVLGARLIKQAGPSPRAGANGNPQGDLFGTKQESLHELAVAPLPSRAVKTTADRDAAPQPPRQGGQAARSKQATPHGSTGTPLQKPTVYSEDRIALLRHALAFEDVLKKRET